MIEVFKILNRFDNVDYNLFFKYDYNDVTRSNGHKLCHKRFQTNVAKNFFTYGIIDKWNNLPHDVVNSTSIDSFKKNLYLFKEPASMKSTQFGYIIISTFLFYVTDQP